MMLVNKQSILCIYLSVIVLPAVVINTTTSSQAQAFQMLFPSSSTSTSALSPRKTSKTTATRTSLSSNILTTTTTTTAFKLNLDNNNSDSDSDSDSDLNSLSSSSSSSFSVIDRVQTRFKIAQESSTAGYGWKQVLADVIAGNEYNENEILSTIDETISSAPCVIYTWESSPSCKKALETLFDVIHLNAKNVKIVVLDPTTSEGNIIRAVLGRKVKRSSVPFVFIDGKYIGGYDGGIDDDDNNNSDASGMVNLAFQGKLRDMLTDAGAM